MTNVGFHGVSDPPGLEICDPVRKRQFTLRTPTRPEPEHADHEVFPFSVETACRITIPGVEVDHVLGFVRAPSGEQLHALHQEGCRQFPEGDYFVELSPAVKTYLHISTAMDVAVDAERVRITFDEPASVTVGARADSRRPTATVTTTPDLDDIRRAVEALSSSLRTTSVERAYPTLRQHPPRIELGDTLSIPGAATPVSTGITIEVRPRLDDLFVVAPLSSYLGAALAFGETPRIVTDDGFERRLSADAFDGAVEEVLRRVFLLDCLTRTHGLYPVDLVEYERHASEFPLDFEALYHASPAERLQAYLSIPDEGPTPGPRWPAIAYVEPRATAVEALPYLVNDLTLVRTEPVETHTGSEARKVALSRFVRSDGDVRGISAAFSGRERLVDVPETDARQQVWVGDGIPLNANELLATAHENRFDRKPIESSEVRVCVICNDPAMAEEADRVEEQYRSSTAESLGITLYDAVPVDRLAELLGQDIEFLHYVGHATERGLECSDGYLDVSEVPTVRVMSFLLNACQSYHQGRALIDGGAIGGIVTLGDVPDGAAVGTGVLVARLLDTGFSLADALSIARRSSMVGGQYMVLGDTSASIAGPAGVIGNVARIETTDGKYLLWTEGYTTREFGHGCFTTVKTPDGWRKYLLGNEVGPIRLTEDEVVEFLALQDVPVWLDESMRWSFDLTRDDLRSGDTVE